MIKLLLALAGALKFGKLLTTGGTMLISLFAYSLVYGWRYAAGFIALLFAHEMGHYIAARQRGLAVGAPTFIPFLGAWIDMKDMPHNAETEAYVGLGGPFLGTLASFACYYLAQAMDSKLLLAISYSGFFLNLFNLIPLSPLDGGRITAVLGPRIWWLGVPFLIGVFLWHPSPVLILVAIAAIPQLAKAWRYRGEQDPEHHYYQVSGEERLTYTAWYLLLVAVLSSMTFKVHEMLGPAS